MECSKELCDRWRNGHVTLTGPVTRFFFLAFFSQTPTLIDSTRFRLTLIMLLTVLFLRTNLVKSSDVMLNANVWYQKSVQITFKVNESFVHAGQSNTIKKFVFFLAAHTDLLLTHLLLLLPAGRLDKALLLENGKYVTFYQVTALLHVNWTPNQLGMSHVDRKIIGSYIHWV